MNTQKLLLFVVAIAIIGVVSLTLFSEDTTEESGDTNGTGTPSQSENGTVNDDTSNLTTFANAEFGIRSVAFPQDTWTVLATTTVGLEPKLNIYVARDAADRAADLPYTHFSNESQVSVFPEGIPTEGLFADRAAFDLETSFPVREDTAVVYTLADGTPFAAYVQPTLEALPDEWEEWGFVFVRARIDGMSTYCTRNGTEVPSAECDPLASDDEVHYEGSVRLTEWAEATDILRSLQLASGDSEMSGPVRVDAPSENALVQSPLMVRGEARGPWYFEATLPIELVAEDGTVLVESFAEANGEWMTTDYVPFKTELSFDVPQGVSEGVVRIQKANPSGLPENDDSYEVPVRF